MTKIELQNLLQQPYDQYNFAAKVLKNIFGNHFELYAMPQSVSPAPTTGEKKTIDTVKRYGEITLDDGSNIACYEVKLQPQVRIEQSRVAIQQYIRKLTFMGSGALVNFISPKTPNTWRLTYIAKDSIITEKGVKTKATHTKRYTYLLGKDESCKTVAERLNELASKQFIDIEAITQAFSIEKLSKAFFDEYKNHYDKFVGHLVTSNFKKSVFKGDEKAIRDFCKKLLGRIVFLYFVQKKGWLGATDTEYADGNRDFITHLFDTAQAGDAFYGAWLSKLFFEALNQERKGDSFEMPTGEKLKIPFLNGGLFEQETFDNTLLTIKADLFRASNPFDVELPNKRGFLDFLNAYNFTIHEDSPDDHTVAVDPEMLGHIFENLLEDNKDKGAFYTPKEIVQYMCRESLAEYLATQCPTIARTQIDVLVKQHETDLPTQDLQAIDAKLDAVKICDPAIGSGAFPMGLLHEIFSLKELIAYQVGKAWNPAEVKANIIQNCIYGVDIEKGAVDIARLRFWLSLIIDEPKPKALPNLDYKIVVGNSLVSKYEDEIIEIGWSVDTTKEGFFGQDFLERNIKLLKETSEKQLAYFTATGKDKTTIAEKIRLLKIDLLCNQLEMLIHTKGIEQKPQGTGKKGAEYMETYLQTVSWKNALKKLKDLKKQAGKPLQFFDWKLDFPEILNPYLSKTAVQENSEHVEAVNEQINALNTQIQAVNKHLKMLKMNTQILRLQANTALGQINIVHQQLAYLQQEITEVYGELKTVQQQIIDKEISPNIAQLKALPAEIGELNDNIQGINLQINQFNTLIKPDDGLGFDIVIGNPPYFNIQTLGAKSLDAEYIQKKYADIWMDKSDILFYFINEGINLSKNQGCVQYIISNAFLFSDKAQRLRNFILQNAPIQTIVNFEKYLVFESAMITTAIVSFKKKALNNIVKALVLKEDTPKDFEKVIADKNKFIDVVLKQNEVFALINQDVERLNTLIDQNKISLGDLVKVGKGMETAANEVFSNENISSMGFPVKFIKKRLNGKAIKRYVIDERFIDDMIYFENIATFEELPSPIQKYLLQNKDMLQNRATVKNEGRVWWRYSRPMHKEYYHLNKIWTSYRSAHNCFAFDDTKNCIGLTNTTVIFDTNPEKISLKYLLALLNSNLLNFRYRSIGKQTGGGIFEYFENGVSKLPIAIISLKQQKPFETIVDYILHLKTLPDTLLQSSFFEQLIDGMVYELYFPELLKEHKREIMKHLGDLPAIDDSMTNAQKMSIIQTVYDRLSANTHPAKTNLFYMDAIPEIAIIEGKNG